ncbi:sugar ABC transporter substrate-binding protein [Microbacterium rhizomatis]|uniref:Sugar ABC transporter substrate-binding protein n=1 Tax=Microbacterium rhizomatis TaxID=1631477 RepID=A0A5J5IYQ1_9MICO|nr:substrate-binding domain-containing protein [Microbacterium rhizomatis]KAA9105615.1 sugar ABC transporter substrate-binding protein [Microbacterium rhizomatis]
MRTDVARGSRAPARRLAAIAVALVLAVAGLTGCAPSSDSAGTIALLLPDAKTSRYETFDRPTFESRVAELGSYQVLYANADQDAAKQQQQAESALANGAGVLVLDPVDGKAAVSIVNAANSAGVPVISYDRLVAGGTLAYYVSFDNEKVGVLQATALVDALNAAGEPDPGILMVNGSPTDSNATSFSDGARSVIDRSDVRILAEYQTPDWSPDKAQAWVAGQISQYGDKIAGVYAANDGTASGAISAFKAAEVSPLPLVTGQDAELSAIQRIVAGEQYMTVYKAIRQQATLAAEIAVHLLKGETVTAPLEVDGVPATLLEPVAVTIDNIMQTVVADGFWTVADICTPNYAEACTKAGIG